MANNRVRVNSAYIYHANLLDRCDGRTGLKDGTIVRVVNVHGCPPANTMGHCYVAEIAGDCKLIGLVHVNSLHTPEEYREYLRKEIARIETERSAAEKSQGFTWPNCIPSQSF